MKFSVDRFINKECVSLSITITWNTGLALEMDLFLWRFDIVFWGF
jgi:hypothetical protein